MKALCKLKSEPGLWMLDDADIPVINDNEVLIKITRSSICGTDIHIFNWDEWSQENVPVPLITGHEYAGVIVEVGSDVKHLKKGTRVSGEGHLVCGTCRNCRAGLRHLCRNTAGIGVNRQGSFAEFLALPAENVITLPDDISDEIGAILDPLGNAAHTALAFNLVGEDILITGAGPIGMMSAAICRHIGARHIVITDINPERLRLAEKLGATRTVDITRESLPEVMSELNMTEGFDVGLEMSGQPAAINDMIDNINSGGKVALLGIPSSPPSPDWNKIIFKGLTLKGIYGREMYETWYKMIAMLQSGLDISPIITHRFPIDRFEEAFAMMNSGNSGKIILEWPDS
jgi:threonine 3-dehydrogenase